MGFYIKMFLDRLFYWQKIRKIKAKDKLDLSFWLKNGLSLPPPEIIKHNIIVKYAKKEKAKIFVGPDSYIGERLPILEIFFHKIVVINSWEGNFTKSLSSKIAKLKGTAVVWIDALTNLEQNNKNVAIQQIQDIIDTVTYTDLQHILLWDNAHVFLNNPHMPHIQEVKAMFLIKKVNYQAMKGENNVFVMSPKL